MDEQVVFVDSVTSNKIDTIYFLLVTKCYSLLEEQQACFTRR